MTANEKLARLVPYEPATGRYEIRLDANESFLDLPPDLKAELARLTLETDFRRYPDPSAEACRVAFGARYGVNPDLLTAGNGSDELIFVLMTAFLQKGDRVVITEPDFSMYAFYARLAEAEIVRVPKGPDFEIDPERVVEICRREKAAMLIFSNPCNPTGRGLVRDDVRKILRGSGCLTVVDEAYMDFWDESLLSEIEEHENLVILRTCSKMMGLAALRLGFAAAGAPLTRLLRAAKSPYNVNALSQALGARVLSRGDLLDDRREQILRSRRRLYERLKRSEAFLGVRVPETVTNFAVLRTEAAGALHEALKARGILVRRFGDALRITAGTEEENEKVAESIYKILPDVL